MKILSLEHSKLACRLDFTLFHGAVVALATFLVLYGPSNRGWETFALVLAGLAGWTAIEYAMHRFVLHRQRPFCHWHAQHHARPAALIYTPTVLSAALIASLVFLPAMLAAGLRSGGALTLGVLTGYLAYSITHHSIHHWHADHAWLHRRKQWHEAHHFCVDSPGNYGVTTAFWDRVFGSVCRSQ